MEDVRLTDFFGSVMRTEVTPSRYPLPPPVKPLPYVRPK